MSGEGVELLWMDDPKDLCRVYLFKVSISNKRLTNSKYTAIWWIVRFLWKAVRSGW